MSEERIIDYDKLNKKELLGAIIGQNLKIEILNNIIEKDKVLIKEAREYIEKHKQKGYRTPMSDDYEFWDELNGDEIKGLLEILSKAGNE